jgi:hypothetical protein
LEPPGTFYQDWDRPLGADDDVMSKVVEAFGHDSGEATTMRLMLDYRRLYGPHIPLDAASQLDLIVETTNLSETLGIAQAETRDSVHSLHAQGLLLIADDGSLWLTVPPGTPYSAPNVQWAFVEKKADAPAERTTVG